MGTLGMVGGGRVLLLLLIDLLYPVYGIPKLQNYHKFDYMFILLQNLPAKSKQIFSETKSLTQTTGLFWMHLRLRPGLGPAYGGDQFVRIKEVPPAVVAARASGSITLECSVGGGAGGGC